MQGVAISCLLILRSLSVTEESDVDVDEDGLEAITVVVSLRVQTAEDKE